MIVTIGSLNSRSPESHKIGCAVPANSVKERGLHFLLEDFLRLLLFLCFLELLLWLDLCLREPPDLRRDACLPGLSSEPPAPAPAPAPEPPRPRLGLRLRLRSRLLPRSRSRSRSRSRFRDADLRLRRRLRLSSSLEDEEDDDDESLLLESSESSLSLEDDTTRRCNGSPSLMWFRHSCVMCPISPHFLHAPRLSFFWKQRKDR